MEFWLIQGDEKLQLPVPPANYKIKTANNNSSFLVEGIGEVAFLGKPKLTEIDPIVSFFPAQNYSFCQYTGFPSPNECVALIEKWRLSGKPIRYIVTDTFINMLCSIESFEPGEDDGTGNISFTLTLKEYKTIDVNSVAVSNLANGYQNTTFAGADIVASTMRPSDKQTPSTYTVKEGDTLYAIAKRLYGDSSKWQTIASNNSINDPSTLQIGTVLTL